MARATAAQPTTRTRHSQAAAMIGQRIVSGEWLAGAALPTEADLSRELNVSRASLREAIKLLAGKGLIRSTPRRGTIVQPTATWNRLDPDVLVWQAFGGPNDDLRARPLRAAPDDRAGGGRARGTAGEPGGPGRSSPPPSWRWRRPSTCRLRSRPTSLSTAPSSSRPGTRCLRPSCRPSRPRCRSPSRYRAPARRSPMSCRCIARWPSRSSRATPTVRGPR